MKNLSTTVWAFLWFATLAITVTIFVLLKDEQEYATLEKLSMGGLLWAESLFFGYIIYADKFSRSSSSSAIAFQATSGIPISFYCLVAFLIGLLGFTGIFSVNAFIIVNLLALLGWLLVQGSLASASQVVERNDHQMIEARAFYKKLQMNFSRICMQVKTNHDEELFNLFQHVNDESLRYCNPDSRPKVQELENELTEMTYQMIDLSQNGSLDNKNALKNALTNFKQALILRNEYLKN